MYLLSPPSVIQLDKEVLHTVAKHCTNLEKLDASGLSSVEDTLLSLLSKHCPKLSYVGFKGCSQVSHSI